MKPAERAHTLLRVLRALYALRAGAGAADAASWAALGVGPADLRAFCTPLCGTIPRSDSEWATAVAECAGPEALVRYLFGPDADIAIAAAPQAPSRVSIGPGRRRGAKEGLYCRADSWLRVDTPFLFTGQTQRALSPSPASPSLLLSHGDDAAKANLATELRGPPLDRHIERAVAGKPVAVVGMAIRAADAQCEAEAWALQRAAADGVGAVPADRWAGGEGEYGGFLKDFDIVAMDAALFGAFLSRDGGAAEPGAIGRAPGTYRGN